MVTSLAVLVVSLVVSPSGNGHQEWVVLALIPLCAFCGTPFWTLEMRQGIGGMAAAVGFPSAVMAVCALVNEQLGVKNDRRPDDGHPHLPLDLLRCRWLAGVRQIQTTGGCGHACEGIEPAGWSRGHSCGTLTRIVSRFGGPVATLLKKEFRLQQISFLLAGVFVLIGAGLDSVSTKSHPQWKQELWGAIFSFTR